MEMEGGGQNFSASLERGGGQNFTARKFEGSPETPRKYTVDHIEYNATTFANVPLKYDRSFWHDV